MTPNEFKIKYPQYAHLEGDALWDMMTMLPLQGDNVLTADPNREIVWLEKEVQFLDGSTSKVFIEDSSTTRWLNKNGEEVKVKELMVDKNFVPTTYRMEIWDASKNDKL